MIKIYLIRHCEAAGNLKKSFQGHTDCDITDDGAKQLEYLKERFSDMQIDKAYSSPLIRAYKTAVAAVGDRNIEIIRDEHFIEQNVGVLEAMPFENMSSTYPDFWYLWDNEPQNFEPEGGERVRDVYERIWQGIKMIADNPENEGKTVVVASHGAAIRALMCRLTFGDIEKLAYTPWSTNTAVSLLVCDENGIRLEFANDASHLPEDLKRTSRLLSAKDE